MVVNISDRWEHCRDEEFIREARKLVGIIQRQDFIILEMLLESLYRGLCYRMGFSSIVDFAIRGLGLGRDQALKRSQIVDAIIRVPEIFDLLAEGKTTFTHLSIAASRISLQTADILLKAMCTMTTHELRKFIKQVSFYGSVFEQ